MGYAKWGWGVVRGGPHIGSSVCGGEAVTRGSCTSPGTLMGAEGWAPQGNRV